jgi:hypothetical protein
VKIYGFYNGSDEPKLLEQVTFEIDTSELRELAKFFTQCAEEMDLDEGWDHEHLCDYLGRVLKQDLVLYNSGRRSSD